MDWKTITEDPNLRDLPFKIETNEFGQIIMNPVKLSHSAYQGEIGHILKEFRDDGIVLMECAIWTQKGTKVADVAWFSGDRWQDQKGNVEALVAPELCVEVASMSNTAAEMNQKRNLFFEQGAHEFWFCDEYGNVTFYDHDGSVENSHLFPDFPTKIDI